VVNAVGIRNRPRAAEAAPEEEARVGTPAPNT
jgi:hypothetical protein